MATIKTTIVEYSNSSLKKDSSNSGNLQKLFPGSPIYKGELSDAERLEFYQSLLNETDLTGNGIIGLNMNYENAPVLDDVKTGGAGLPATPFSPNPTSPGAGSYLASDQAEFTGDTKKPENISNFGSGLGGLVSPATTSKSISDTKIGDYVSGRSYQGSDGKA
jgi:hypothetical protein